MLQFFDYVHLRIVQFYNSRDKGKDPLESAWLILSFAQLFNILGVAGLVDYLTTSKFLPHDYGKAIVIVVALAIAFFNHFRYSKFGGFNKALKRYARENANARRRSGIKVVIYLVGSIVASLTIIVLKIIENNQ